ncbi:hypothetical protein T4B_886 [Trichinella pseudospiralis]|uniref:Uncharacterized protein n=1 Tax=Trichinella pseudospiralis TaxID=6337 RepID=A0A0V1GU16_TRIPS|nr:hypothetical protein T4A_4248 [Trichinella pseudospiralis]KRY73769.1 hypothetical protein T4A_13433 [Trichinella pseudospiralis]KRZ01337.1 hypothetical protein T4B_9431 [Trichinella pseudospiralis]KRZ01783.1 hypothetical protein T4B_1149 [Trichinella pseudospiralis]KRZ23043.1 hypothetical protein T4C_10019 [Trichinella pseudospiralis]
MAGLLCILPIPLTMTDAVDPTTFRALATFSVTRVVSSPLSNRQFIINRLPFVPQAMTFTVW